MAVVRQESKARKLLAALPSNRMRLFVKNLAKDPLRNAARACRGAGYSQDPRASQVTGSRLLTRTDVYEAYIALRDELRTDVDVSPEDITKELAKVAFADKRRLYDAETGALIPVHLLDDETAAAVSEVSIEREQTTKLGIRLDDAGDEVAGVRVKESVVKVKMHDKVGALRTLAAIKGMVTKTHKHEGKVTLEQLLSKSRE